MITVTHNKVVQEAFKLVELRVTIMGHPVMLRVPVDFQDYNAIHLRHVAEKRFSDFVGDKT